MAALRHSHDALRANVEPLDEDSLRQRSYCSDWSIGRSSPLGSGAEIFGLPGSGPDRDRAARR